MKILVLLLVLVASGCASWQAKHDPKTEKLTVYGRIYNAPLIYPLQLLDGLRQFNGPGWKTTKERK
jgi:hypothetical protein